MATSKTCSKLCCTLNPFIICEGCKEQWCEECWSPISGTDIVFAHPYSRDGYEGGGIYRRLCKSSNVVVEYSVKPLKYPITFKAVRTV